MRSVWKSGHGAKAAATKSAIGATIGRALTVPIPNERAVTGAVIAATSAPRKHAGTRKTPTVGDGSRRSDIGVITGLGLRTVQMMTDGVPRSGRKKRAGLRKNHAATVGSRKSVTGATTAAAADGCQPTQKRWRRETPDKRL